MAPRWPNPPAHRVPPQGILAPYETSTHLWRIWVSSRGDEPLLLWFNFCIDDAEFCWRLPQQLLWSSNTVSLITPISVRTHQHTHTRTSSCLTHRQIILINATKRGEQRKRAKKQYKVIVFYLSWAPVHVTTRLPKQSVQNSLLYINRNINA